MFWKSLLWRLLRIFITITLVLTISIYVVMYVSIQSKFYDVFKDSIEKGFKEFNDYIARNGISKLTLEQLETILEINDGNNKGQNGAVVYFSITGQYKSYTIINVKNKSIVKSSDPRDGEDSFTQEIFSSRNLLAVLAGKEIGDKNAPVKKNGKIYYDYARLMNLSDGKYILYFRNDREEWKGIITGFSDIVLYGSIIAIVLAVILGYIFAKTITVPIVNLMNKAKRISLGEFGQLLDVKSDDEIGQLTDTFNIMALELKNTLLVISGEKNKLETVLYYMTDGVIAYGKNGKIIHVNPAARRMLGHENAELEYDDFARKFNFGLTINDIIYVKNINKKETTIKIKDKFFRLYYATIINDDNHSEGLITVIQDITELQRLDEMRKEFVANVSHELKTPLTSIKSYAETLLESELDDKGMEKKFLGVINSEADRMNRLVMDLLQLSRFDNCKMALNLKNVSITNIVNRALEKLQIEIEQKKQKVKLKFNEVPNINIDEDKVEQLILNIVSNAIKYTYENGEIEISINNLENKHIKMVFKDNGIGIPEEDLKLIFERFYRVDKARSREMGGTGLGLSIAKEIVEAHKGIIRIYSTYGKGTSAVIYLPIT